MSTLSESMDPRDALSFRRPATIAEIEAGSAPFMLWNVEPTGHHHHDREVGEAMASELADFMVENDQFADRYMLSEMMRDMLRHAGQDHRFIIAGFGTRLAELAALGALLSRPLADWPKPMRDAVAIQQAVGSDTNLGTDEAKAGSETQKDAPSPGLIALENELWDLRMASRTVSVMTTRFIGGVAHEFKGAASAYLIDEHDAGAFEWQVDALKERAEAAYAAYVALKPEDVES